MSGTCKRLSGTPSWLGNSHANAFTATTTSGGKTCGSTASGTFLKADKALFIEALSPLGDNLPTGIQTRGNLVIVEPFSSHEDDLGPNDFTIR